MAWKIRLSVCLSSVTCVHPILMGFNVSGIFLRLIVGWPPGNSPTKNHEDRPRGSPPPRGYKQEGGGQTGESGISPPISRYLFITARAIYTAGE